MIQTLIRNWWLLALCGVLDAIISVIYFDHASQGFGLKGTILFVGKLTLVGGACTVAAGMWRSTQGKCWFIVLNGLALGALGLVLIGTFGFRISILTVAFLMILMAMSIGSLELLMARNLGRRRHLADRVFLTLAGVASVVFALVFLALGLRWINLEPGSHSDLVWLGSYFGFSAICKLGLALRLHRVEPPESGEWAASPLAPNTHPTIAGKDDEANRILRALPATAPR